MWPLFLASDPFIIRFYKNLSIEGSEAQKQRLYELLWILRFDERNISNLGTIISYSSTICTVYVQFIGHLDASFLQSVYYYLLLGKEGYLMLPFDKKNNPITFVV